MFNSFFDHNGDSILVKEDIEGFLERMRNFRGFSKTDERYLKMRDVLFAFYDCMMDQVQKETRASEANQGYDSWSDALAAKSETVESGVNLNQWLNMWGRLCSKLLYFGTK